jgi:hypothetical protein
MHVCDFGEFGSLGTGARIARGSAVDSRRIGLAGLWLVACGALVGCSAASGASGDDVGGEDDASAPPDVATRDDAPSAIDAATAFEASTGPDAAKEADGGEGVDASGFPRDDGGDRADATTGGDASYEAGGGDAAPNLGWTNQTNIEGIFTKYCFSCHGTQFSSCFDVQSIATDIETVVSSGSMPRGQTMAAADKQTLLAWLKAGAKCTGVDPEDAGAGQVEPPVPIVGGAAPAQ